MFDPNHKSRQQPGDEGTELSTSSCKVLIHNHKYNQFLLFPSTLSEAQPPESFLSLLFTGLQLELCWINTREMKTQKVVFHTWPHRPGGLWFF